MTRPSSQVFGTEMMFDHFDQVAEVDKDVCICSLDQIRKPSTWSSGDRSGLAWPHCNPKLQCSACHIGLFGKALETGVAVESLFIYKHQLGNGVKSCTFAAVETAYESGRSPCQHR